jgi:hypothetical protein
MMKKFTILLLLSSSFTFAQFTTGIVTLGTSGITAKIETNVTKVTLTLTGPSNAWFGIGFGGLNMRTATDMFIWNSTANRDYTNGSNTTSTAPIVDTGGAGNQNWTIVSDTAPSTIRTIVATRNLVSTGDYTFQNNTSSINIIFAAGTSTMLGFHDGVPNSRVGATTVTRTTLGLEDFSLNATTIYPVPSRDGIFTIQSKTGIDSIGIYTQTGAFVKTINVSPSSNTEVVVEGLLQGVYLIELKNNSDRSWKKVVVE